MATALESASLVMIPSGYEEGTLGSLQPLDGTGDFTFSRGSNLSATRVKQDGYIEKGYENLLLQSNSFDTTWTQSAVSVTSGQSGYDGTNDAWLQSKTSGPYVNIAQSIAISGVWTLSIYAKANTLDSITFRNQTNGDDCDFDLTNGTTSTNTTIASSINLISNGWYRCSATFSGSTTQIAVYLGFGNSTAGSVFIQDAQLNQGLVAYPYLETTTTSAKGGILENTPRIDYTGGGAGSLLLEPSRSNLIVHSEYITGTQGTSTFNAITSPEGVNNGLLFVENTATTSHGFLRGATIPTNANAVDYTISIFAKKKEREYIQLSFFAEGAVISSSGFNLINGTTSGDSATHKIEDFGNGWYRCSFTASVLQSTGAYNFSRISTGITESSFYYQGDGTSGVYFYGWQVEQNATYPTSYIPTYGTSQTRAVDVCVGAGDVNTFNSTEGVLYAEIAALGDGGVRMISISDGSLNNQVSFEYSVITNLIRIRLISGAVEQSFYQSTSYDYLQYHKIAISYKLNNFKVYIDGTEVYTDTSSIMPIGLNELNFANSNTASVFYGKAKQVLVFNQALSDEALIELTTI